MRCPICGQAFSPAGLAIHEGMKHKPPRPTLDAAWVAVEAALPVGWVIEEVRHFDDRTGWSASAHNDTGAGRYRWSGYGTSPVEALLALAAILLRETP